MADYTSEQIRVDLSQIDISSLTPFKSLFKQFINDGRFLPYCAVNIDWSGVTGGDATNDFNLDCFGAKDAEDRSDDVSNQAYLYRLDNTIAVVSDADLFNGASPADGSSQPYLIGRTSLLADIGMWHIGSSWPFQYISMTNAALTGVRHDAGIILINKYCWG